MRLLVVLVVALTLPGVSLAGAAEGQFMGYRLGDSYQRSGQTQERITTSGNLAIEAENAIKPADVGDVTLVVTPETLTIGYINALTWFDTEADAREFGRKYVELLRAKYPDWAFGREVMDANVRVVEVNLDKHPLNLRMQLTKGPRDGKTMWRISMTLRWLPDTDEEKAWRKKSYAEQVAMQDKNRQLLLDQADTRGL
mgnify:CR=1 FL=1|jgi:hypothetical protein